MSSNNTSRRSPRPRPRIAQAPSTSVGVYNSELVKGSRSLIGTAELSGAFLVVKLSSFPASCTLHIGLSDLLSVPVESSSDLAGAHAPTAGAQGRA